MVLNTVLESRTHYDKYDAIIHKKVHSPGHEKSLLDHIVQSTRYDEFYSQHFKKRLGNEEGLALLDTVENNTSRMNELQDELLGIRDSVNTIREENSKIQEENSKIRGESAKIQEENSKIQKELSSETNARISLRRGALEDRRISNRDLLHKDQNTTFVRNEVAHGGDIINDIKAIQYVQEEGLPYTLEYKEDFHSAYGISFDQAVTKASAYPPEVIRAFDVRVSLRERRPWQASAAKENRLHVEKLASGIVGAALSLEREQLEARLGNGGDLLKKFNEMNWLFGGRN